MNSNRRKSWMWAEACALLDEAERKHRRFFELLAVPASPPVWEPPADIFADGSDLQVVVALPGARAEEVVVQIPPTGLQIETLVPPPSLSAQGNEGGGPMVSICSPVGVICPTASSARAPGNATTTWR